MGGAEYEKKAEEVSGWEVFSRQHKSAADGFSMAAHSYNISEAYHEAAGAYIKLADCHLKLDSKHEAASAYVDAATCYKKSNPPEAVRKLHIAGHTFEDILRLFMASKHYKEIPEIYEKESGIEKDIVYYDKAGDLYIGEGVQSTANQRKLKFAQCAVQLQQYETAIEIYENVAKQSMNNNLLKYSAKGYLLNAALCQLCGKDIVAFHNAIEKYQKVDPTFSSTLECKLLQDLANAIDEVDIVKFTDVVKEFDHMSRLERLTSTLLSRAKNALKTKEVDEDDLT